jgi:hypothetical protein
MRSIKSKKRECVSRNKARDFRCDRSGFVGCDALRAVRDSLQRNAILPRLPMVLTPNYVSFKRRYFGPSIATIFASAHHIKLALTIKQSIRHQRIRVQMKVQIFAEGVDRNHDRQPPFA